MAENVPKLLTPPYAVNYECLARQPGDVTGKKWNITGEIVNLYIIFPQILTLLYAGLKNVPPNNTRKSDELVRMANYLARYQLGVETGYISDMKTHGTIVEHYGLTQKTGLLSAAPTELLAATLTLAHMVNALIASAFHKPTKNLTERLDEIHRAANLFGSSLCTIDSKAGSPPIYSSIYHLCEFFTEVKFFDFLKISQLLELVHFFLKLLWG